MKLQELHTRLEIPAEVIPCINQTEEETGVLCDICGTRRDGE